MTRRHADQDPTLLLSVTLYLNAYAELEGALRWTAELPPAIKVPAFGPAVDETVDEVLDECRRAEDFFRHVVAECRVLNGLSAEARPHHLPDDAILREEASRLFRLATRVLELRVMFGNGPIRSSTVLDRPAMSRQRR